MNDSYLAWAMRMVVISGMVAVISLFWYLPEFAYLLFYAVFLTAAMFWIAVRGK